jgi:D-alanyl-D-alanine carboxypeptidase (penicillin-binding protein 5/6)
MRLSALTALFLLILPIQTSQAWDTKAKQAFIMDFETGQVLLAKNAYEAMPTSSMSKVMTTYMVFEALKNGTIEMDTKFPVSEKAWRKGGSKMFVELGKEIKVKDLLRGVIVQSGNDATIVLAEGLSGSEDAFAKSMTQKAMEIGMEDSNFVNASGWPDPDHYSTAHDLAVMAKHLIKDFPEYYKMFAETEFTYNSIKQQNRNPLLYRDIGADGIKTGHTEAGGYGLIGSAEKDGRRVIMVLNGMESEEERVEESIQLINWSLNSFENVTLAQKGQKVAEAAVAMGTQDKVDLIIGEDIKMTIPKSAKNNYTINVAYKNPLIAPIQEGEEIGKIVFNIPDMESLTYPLYASEGVEEVGFLKRTLLKFQYTLFGTP